MAAVLEQEELIADEKPVSKRRSREQGRGRLTSPIDQVRMAGNYGPTVDAVGAHSYWIRLDGATIMDALILNPNGGRPPVIGDDRQRRRRARLGNNSEYFRAKQEAKRDPDGNPLFEYIGPSLTEKTVRRLVEVIMANREDEILYVTEEIEDAERSRENADRPEIRQQARRRIEQLSRRKGYLEQEINPEEMLEELNALSRAQRLRSLPAGMLEIINEVVGDAERRLDARYLDRITSGRTGRALPKGAKAMAVPINLGEEDD